MKNAIALLSFFCYYDAITEKNTLSKILDRFDCSAYTKEIFWDAFETGDLILNEHGLINLLMLIYFLKFDMNEKVGFFKVEHKTKS